MTANKKYQGAIWKMPNFGVFRWAGQLLVVALQGVVLTGGQGDHLKNIVTMMVI